MIDFRKLTAKAGNKAKKSIAKLEAKKNMQAEIKAQKQRDLLEKVDRVKFMYEKRGVKVINICTWLEVFFQDCADEAEISKKLFAWCKKNKAHYYAKPKDMFNEAEAIDEAKALNRRVLIVEDLS